MFLTRKLHNATTINYDQDLFLLGTCFELHVICLSLAMLVFCLVRCLCDFWLLLLAFVDQGFLWCYYHIQSQVH